MKPKKKSLSQKAAVPAPPQPSPAEPTAIGQHQAPAAGPPPASAAAPIRVPPLLLEADTPAPNPLPGPGQRYQLTPSAPPPHWGEAASGPALPEAYGTQRLGLTARDPHWLYAQWDLTREQQTHYNALSVDGHLVLRLDHGETTTNLLKEVHLHPEARHWFVHVAQANAHYTAQLGYHAADGTWTVISVSPPALTPPDTVSVDASVQLATVPFTVPFAKLREELKPPTPASQPERLPLLEAARQPRPGGTAGAAPSIRITAADWTVAQEQALAEAVPFNTTKPMSASSGDLPELVRRQLESAALSPPAGQPPDQGSWSGALGGVSSPGSAAAPAAKREFWFSVNAELVVYGATEPDAQVMLGSRPVTLRPDGTFSFRFALPDGQYELPAVAVSAHAWQSRRANLRFTRQTEYHGDVGVHPEDPTATIVPAP